MAEVRDDLEALAIELCNAKDVENQAKIARVKAEEALAEAIGGKDIGSTSVKCGRISVSVKRGYNYKVEDMKAFSIEFPMLVKQEFKLNASAYEAERREDSNIYAEAAKYVTATPAKVSVTLKL